MNNYILQKIIHAYQNGGTGLGVPGYLDGVKIRGKESVKEFNRHLKLLSNNIQQSAKFYVDLSEGELKPEEMMRCLEGTKFYLPYPCTFIQFKHKKGYYNVLLNETGADENQMPEEVCDYTLQFLYSDFSGNKLVYNPVLYHLSNIFFDEGMYIDNTYNMQIDISGFGVPYMKEKEKSIEEAKDLVAAVNKCYLNFLVMLNHPEITKSKEVLGRPNNLVGHVPVKNMNRSTLMKKPKYQHKTLIIDMYGEKSDGESSSGKRSKGTAFHSVRKHLRQYQNGKKIFVKAHFRGSKEVGIIQKDYKVISDAKSDLEEKSGSYK